MSEPTRMIPDGLAATHVKAPPPPGFTFVHAAARALEIGVRRAAAAQAAATSGARARDELRTTTGSGVISFPRFRTRADGLSRPARGPPRSRAEPGIRSGSRRPWNVRCGLRNARNDIKTIVQCERFVSDEKPPGRRRLGATPGRL